MIIKLIFIHNLFNIKYLIKRKPLIWMITLSLFTATIPASAESQKNWGLENVKAHSAWKIEEGKQDIIVAVIDTGIDPKHKNKGFICDIRQISFDHPPKDVGFMPVRHENRYPWAGLAALLGGRRTKFVRVLAGR